MYIKLPLTLLLSQFYLLLEETSYDWKTCDWKMLIHYPIFFKQQSSCFRKSERINFQQRRKWKISKSFIHRINPSTSLFCISNLIFLQAAANSKVILSSCAGEFLVSSIFTLGEPLAATPSLLLLLAILQRKVFDKLELAQITVYGKPDSWITCRANLNISSLLVSKAGSSLHSWAAASFIASSRMLMDLFDRELVIPVQFPLLLRFPCSPIFPNIAESLRISSILRGSSSANRRIYCQIKNKCSF